jgi:predicted nucleic-acid-binding protein
VIAIDTNIVVRFLTRDNETQFQKSYKLFKSHDIFIPDTVILESEWVLRYAYNYDTTSITDAFTRLFGLPNVRLANPTIVAQAIQWHINGLDFADALHLSQCQQYNELFTFDKKFINKAKGIGGCIVLNP